ncbi:MULTISPECIES: alpha/beta hydrolase [Methylotenera]|uniref:alpha/beta hydrolase n=1 Tax=Methylotenera TaxID=359407 RepID=UPI00036453FD|nr:MULTISPECIES: alpha/beta hydrolase [Methylotenera]
MLKPIKSMLGFVLLMTTSACSPIKLLNAVVPESTYQLHSAVAYGDLPRQKLDIYIPSQISPANSTTRKVVIFFYGGSWDSGNRGDYKFVGEALASQGFIVVIPDYRVYPEVLFPAFMADPALAARWVKDNIQQYQGDTQQVFLAGHSAGAHIAVMLGVNAEYLAKQFLKLSDFAGIIGLAGPYDFLPLKSERLKTIFGPSSEQWRSQPINFVDGKNPPMLLAVGTKDDTVWPRNTYNMAEKIKKNNGLVKVVTFEGYGHIDMAAKLAKPLRGDGELLKAVTDFIKHTNTTN